MSQRPNRRFYQFSLGSLLLALTALGGWLGVHMNRVQQQKTAVVEIRRLGGQLMFASNQPSLLARIPLIGDALSCPVIVEVHFLGLAVRDENVDRLVEPLRRLGGLEAVKFVESTVTPAGARALEARLHGVKVGRQLPVLQPTSKSVRDRQVVPR